VEDFVSAAFDLPEVVGHPSVRFCLLYVSAYGPAASGSDIDLRWFTPTMNRFVRPRDD
jgi:hypothetical protein